MNIQDAWGRAQRINALIGPRPDIRDDKGNKLVENFDDITLTVGGEEIRLASFDEAQTEIQLRGLDDNSWQ